MSLRLSRPTNTFYVAINMSSARLIRPFARAFQRPIARASLSTKSIAPFTPSVTAQLQGKTQKKTTPAPAPEIYGIPIDKMVR